MQQWAPVEQQRRPYTGGTDRDRGVGWGAAPSGFFPAGNLVLQSSRRQYLRLLAIATVLVVTGIVIVLRSRQLADVVAGWLVIAFFGAGAVLFVAVVIRPARLRVDDRSITLDRWGRRSTWALVDCGEFRVWRSRYAPQRPLVTFEYYGPGGRRRSERRLDRLNRRLGGSTDTLPDTFGLPAEYLARLLNDRRAARPAPD